jgi:hypothetical protein
METDLVCLTSATPPTCSKIDHRDYSKAYRTLGIWPNPTGTQMGYISKI